MSLIKQIGYGSYYWEIYLAPTKHILKVIQHYHNYVQEASNVS